MISWPEPQSAGGQVVASSRRASRPCGFRNSATSLDLDF